jgi:CRP-like cAMP-binding protein
MSELLELVQHLPVVELAPGDVLIDEGTRTGSVWVLIAGSLDVIKGDVVIDTIVRPGTTFGELSILTDSDHGASVVAKEVSTLHAAVDGRALLLDNPEVLLRISAGIAGRLNAVTSYLADLRHQYTGAPGIDMVSSVLGKLVHPPTVMPQPGSLRDPDPEY